MELQTHIDLPIGELQISHTDSLMLLGSCFAQNIGTKLADSCFRSLANPFGVLYNPASIAAIVKAVFGGSEEWREAFHQDQRQEIWLNWLGDTSFWRESYEECEKAFEEKLNEARLFVRSADVLVLTLGTNHVYKMSSRCVTNCHKQPQSLFVEHVMDVGECVTVLSEAIECALSLRPELKVIVTVSPIRYKKYGFHGSQLSKATLLLATEELQQRFDSVRYFPAYEIVVDQLRDYRFYADDMIHPSTKTVDYIWQCFSEAYLTDDARRAAADFQQYMLMLRHRPMTKSEKQLRMFEQQIMLKKEQLKAKYPYFAEC